MKFSEYSPLALRTAKPLTLEQNLQHAAILLVSEAGEIADSIKSFAVYGKPLDSVNLVEEVGDLLWGLNLYVTTKGINPKILDSAVERYSTFSIANIKTPWDLVNLGVVIGALSSTIAVRRLGVKKDLVGEDIDPLCFGLVRLLDYIGSTFEKALQMNLDKLSKRYGEKYSDYLALNRDISGERLVLEGKNAATS